MTNQTRRVWRAGPATLVLVWIFALAAGVAVPVLAYLIYQQGGAPWIPGALVVLTVLESGRAKTITMPRVMLAVYAPSRYPSISLPGWAE